jgi:hypothetical protein
MAKTLSQIGIDTTQTVEAWHVTQSIDAFTGAEAYNITLSGSFNMTGPINGQPGLVNPLTASYVISSSYAETSTSASNALTASHAPNIFNSNGTITSNRTASLGSYALLFDGTNSNIRYTPNSAGGYLLLEGKTPGVPRIGVSIPASSSYPVAGFQLGMRAWDDISFSGYGKIGDAFFYAGNATNGLNFMNPVGTGTEDYIRFYAGNNALAISDIHVHGTGSNRGYVGINTESPNTRLDVNGNVLITGSLTISSSATTIQDETRFTSPKTFSTGGGTLNANNATRISLQIDGTTTTTLSDGNDGQIIYLYCTQQISVGSHTITPSNAVGFTSIEFNKIGQTAVIMFMTNKWYLFSSYGVTISS